MDELAKAAGVGKGTLYRRFADRASLCHALLNEQAIALQDEALAGFGVPFGPPWLDHAAKFLDALFDFTVDNASLLSEARSFERGGPDRFDHPAHRWQRDTLAGFLERAMQNREIAEVRPQIAAEMILAPLDPDLVTYHLQRDLPREELRAEFRRHWRSGLETPAAARSI